LCLRWIRHKYKPKRRRASLAAAVHMAACAVSAVHPCHGWTKPICSPRSFDIKMKPAHLILLLVMNFCWAAAYSSYKVIALPTGGIVTLRFGLAATSLLLLWPWLPGPMPRGRDLWIRCLMGLILYVIGQRLQVYGNQLG